jgi:DNA transformation protein and related proteins
LPKRKSAYIAFVLDALAEVPDLTWRHMFGGYGLYGDGVFFGIIWKDRLFFRVDAASEKKYLAKGSSPFIFKETQRAYSYYEVPESVLKNHRTAAKWALTAIEVQKARQQK